ncbi:MarR family transcriptional regulator [Alisedimentitalea sp. MJ-SS2]|uniref:MarR family winged helix-turn-helix transcriptional regulator n=1 Tax=Aliisedimentitalea sp. MJ-SS2 TaxID=3049795 RepID=UPI002908EE8D|nr:MarR family transcriptional regulator [Alisedimentitalea sp. MJ-SS2]MDU8927823.1 MarR family transcriptional regulator [Alisedimentitalea sp. MJ-SS2]
MTDDETRRTRENSLGWMIQRIAGALNREMTRQLEPLDLSLPQFAVMMTVLEHDGLPQSEIAALIHGPAYAVSRALDRLEDQGRIERRSHASSRRAVAVHVTDAGRALAGDLQRIVNEVNTALVTPLATDADRALLKTLLQQILPSSDRPG